MEVQTQTKATETKAVSCAKQGPFFTPVVQPKLQVNNPNDIYEQEADAMADKVMRMSNDNTNANSFFKPSVKSIQRKCKHCEEESRLQRKPANNLVQRDDNDQQPSILSGMPRLSLSSSLLSNAASGPDFLAMRQPFFNRHVAHLWDADSALQIWNYNLNFFQNILGPQSSLATSAANMFTPMFIDAQLKAGNPTWWEITDREMNTSSHMFSLPLLQFDPDFSPSAPSWFNSLTGNGGNGVQRKCAHCEEEEKQLQKKESSSESTPISSGTESYINNLSGGRGLTQSEKNFFEPRMGYDFSNVRIHTDSCANQSAKDINALAYTHSNNIVFGTNQYQPESNEGKRLMAHELTHVVQQSKNVFPKIQRVVDNVEINCGDNQIRFSHDGQITGYDLNHCDITDGTYNSTVRLSPARVDFDLGTLAQPTHFDFDYSIAPGQPNPNIFFLGQQTVPITCSHVPSTGGSRSFDVTFESYPLGSVLGSLGSTSRLVAMGDLSWLSAGNRMRWGTMMGGTTWDPMFNAFPGEDSMLLDRIIDIGDGSTTATSELTLALEPRLQSQLRTGGPFSWISHGFTPEQLTSIEELVRRMNTDGIGSLSDAELSLLRRAAQLHFDGAMAGSPFASYTPPGATAPFLSSSPAGTNVRYRVRVRVNSANVLDGVTPSEFSAPDPTMLSNPGEFDMLVTTNADGELLSIQRVTSGADAPGWIMGNEGVVRWGGRLFMVAGAALSIHHIASASDQERPRVVTQEAGSWGGSYLGAELGAGACIALGIATEGVGLLICGLVGGAGGGFIGSHAATSAYDATPGIVDTVTEPLQEGYQWLDRGVRDIYGLSNLGF